MGTFLREFGLLILLTLEGIEARGLLPVILVCQGYTIQVEFVLDCLGQNGFLELLSLLKGVIDQLVDTFFYVFLFL